MHDLDTGTTVEITAAVLVGPAEVVKQHGDWACWQEQRFHPTKEDIKGYLDSLAVIGLYTITAGVLSKRGDVYKGAGVGKPQEPA